MPQLTDRSKLPNIVDPVIKNTMDPKHLYQVCELEVKTQDTFSTFIILYYIINDVASIKYSP